MAEILDDEFNNSNSDIDLTSNIKTKSFLYTAIMLIGGMLYMKYNSGFKPTMFNLLSGSIVLFIFTLIICGFFVIIASRIRKKKETKKGINKIYDPIWFQAILTGFFLWSVFIIIILLGKII